MLLLLLACSKMDDGGDDSIVDTPQYTCVDVAQADKTTPSGILYCSANDAALGYLNRDSALACAGDARSTVPQCKNGHDGSCLKDSDCGPGHACGGPWCGPSCECYDVCASDSDCGADETCMCALTAIPFDNGGGAYSPGSIDRCLPGNCRTGADCASGECGASTRDYEGGPILGFYCRTPEDVCRTNGDCGDGYDQCAYDPSWGYWACSKGVICD
jgi:hypothetical protein